MARRASSVGQVIVNTDKLRKFQEQYKTAARDTIAALALDGRKRCVQLAKTGFTEFGTNTGDRISGLTSELQVHTGGMMASFYVVTGRKGGIDDYEACKGRMLQKYSSLYGPDRASKWVAPKVNVGPKQAAFGSASRVMAYWEYGHDNRWTGKHEYNPILRPVREELKAVAARRMDEAIKRARTKR